MSKSYKLQKPFESSVLTSINLEADCEQRGIDGSYILESVVSKALDQEEQAGKILSLYRQMKLQEQFKKCDDLDKNFRESQLYTNKRLLNDIAQDIEDNDCDYPMTYQELTKDINTNQILTAIQLKAQHLNRNPLAKK